MIYIKELTKITDEKYSIGYKHYTPFDDVKGLHKTKDELLQDGQLVELSTRSQEVAGKNQELYYNPINNTCFWDYIDNSVIQKQIDSLGQIIIQEKLKNIQKDTIINSLGKQLVIVKMNIINIQGGIK